MQLSRCGQGEFNLCVGCQENLESSRLNISEGHDLAAAGPQLVCIASCDKSASRSWLRWSSCPHRTVSQSRRHSSQPAATHCYCFFSQDRASGRGRQLQLSLLLLLVQALLSRLASAAKSCVLMFCCTSAATTAAAATTTTTTSTTTTTTTTMTA